MIGAEKRRARAGSPPRSPRLCSGIDGPQGIDSSSRSGLRGKPDHVVRDLLVGKHFFCVADGPAKTRYQWYPACSNSAASRVAVDVLLVHVTHKARTMSSFTSGLVRRCAAATRRISTGLRCPGQSVHRRRPGAWRFPVLSRLRRPSGRERWHRAAGVDRACGSPRSHGAGR